MQKEIEIKFRVDNLRSLSRKLREAGFHLETPSTHEMNTLYDLPGQVLRQRKELLRLREFGSR
jgi:inorganic triphosphatase YgiF